MASIVTINPESCNGHQSEQVQITSHPHSPPLSFSVMLSVISYAVFQMDVFEKASHSKIQSKPKLPSDV
jgi:hypothetical protein